MDQRLRFERHRHVECAADIETLELRRRHADDRDRCAVDDERCTDDAVSPCEAPLPESVADDRDRAVRPASGPIVR